MGHYRAKVDQSWLHFSRRAELEVRSQGYPEGLVIGEWSLSSISLAGEKAVLVVQWATLE